MNAPGRGFVSGADPVRSGAFPFKCSDQFCPQDSTAALSGIFTQPILQGNKSNSYQYKQHVISLAHNLLILLNRVYLKALKELHAKRTGGENETLYIYLHYGFGNFCDEFVRS